MRNKVYRLLIGCVVLISAFGCGSEMNEPNVAPMLISAGEAIFPQTRTGIVYTIIGSDPDGDKLLYAISGPDAASFLVDENTGELTFRIPPDVDAPGSVDGDNFYFIDVTVKDPSSAKDTQSVIIEVSRHDPEGPFLFRDGSVFLGPNTITPADPSILQTLNFITTEIRTVPDNRFPNSAAANVHIFQAIYENGTQIEMVVNTQISPFSIAERQAEFYADILGKLDPVLIEGIKSVFIHPGNANFTGPVGMIVVHTGRAEIEYIPNGTIEEVMAHEAVHASIDALYLGSREWKQAQKSDVSFLSEYARDFVETEDLAESYGAFLLVKKAERNAPATVNKIKEGLSHRILFFETLGF
jgi:hypothetical protein